MASYLIQNAPANLSMQDFKSVSDQHGSLAKAARFAAIITPIGRYVLEAAQNGITKDLTYLCEIGELPGRGLMNIDVRYYGPNHKLPFQTQYEDLNLTFLCRNRSMERQFFDDWMWSINPTNTFDFSYRDDYRSKIDLYQFNNVGNEHKAEYKITVHNAYPILINPQPMSWSDDQFQRLVVSFTYTHWTREGYDTEPRGGEPPNWSYDLFEGKTNVPRP